MQFSALAPHGQVRAKSEDSDGPIPLDTTEPAHVTNLLLLGILNELRFLSQQRQDQHLQIMQNLDAYFQSLMTRRG